MAPGSRPAPAFHVPPRGPKGAPLAPSSHLVSEAGGERSVGPRASGGSPPAPTWVRGEPSSVCPGQALPLGPRGPAGPSYSPLISCPASHHGSPKGLHLSGSPARCQASCLRVTSLTLSPGTRCGCRALGSSPVHGGTHGRGQSPSSSAAVPRRGHTGESTPRRWHMGRWGSGTGPGCRWPRTPRHPPACGTEQRLDPAGFGDRCPPGETEAGSSVLRAVSVGTPALQPFPRPGSPLPLRC